MTGHESLTDYDAFARELGAAKTFKKPFKDDLLAAVNELSGENPGEP